MLCGVLQGCAPILVRAHPHGTLLLTLRALQCLSELSRFLAWGRFKAALI